MNKPDTPLQRKLDAETRKAKVEVLAALERLQHEEHHDGDLGICNSVRYATVCSVAEQNSILAALFIKWPEFSGDSKYPVPGFDGLSPADAFDGASSRGTMWDQATEYGQARMRILEFSIRELRTELEEVTA